MAKKTKEKFNNIQHHKKKAFLIAYSETGNISRSAEIAQIDRSTHYIWLKEDPDYAAAFDEAEKEAGDKLELEARRRAIEGTLKPVFYKGKEVGVIREYSDTLLIFLLKGAKPEKYKDRVESESKVTMDADIKADMNITYDLSKLSVEELRQLESILSKTSSTE